MRHNAENISNRMFLSINLISLKIFIVASSLQLSIPVVLGIFRESFYEIVVHWGTVMQRNWNGARVFVCAHNTCIHTMNLINARQVFTTFKS